MNRVEGAFAEARGAGRKTLVPFAVGGAPDGSAFPRILAALERAGAGVIEVGMPFSDPVADGPVIAAAMHEALRRGATTVRVFDGIREAREAHGVRAPIVLMTSVSLVERFGAEAFARAARDAGADGVIFPDAPLEESPRYTEPARRAGLATTLLIAPMTPPDRAEAIAHQCSGFVYLLARAGITGGGGTLDVASLRERIALVRRATSVPIAVGFGIATAAHVRAAVHEAGADGAIVGSALVAAIGAVGRPESEKVDSAEAAHSFVVSLVSGLLSA